MPAIDRSIALPTGMIIGGLYVILLVGFTQESYMRRDASRGRTGVGWTAVDDVSNRVCRAGSELCVGSADASDRQSCVVSLATVRQFLVEPVPLSFQGLRRALRELR